MPTRLRWSRCLCNTFWGFRGSSKRRRSNGFPLFRRVPSLCRKCFLISDFAFGQSPSNWWAANAGCWSYVGFLFILSREARKCWECLWPFWGPQWSLARLNQCCHFSREASFYFGSSTGRLGPQYILLILFASFRSAGRLFYLIKRKGASTFLIESR